MSSSILGCVFKWIGFGVVALSLLLFVAKTTHFLIKCILIQQLLVLSRAKGTFIF
jgi:hypothetical protein